MTPFANRQFGIRQEDRTQYRLTATNRRYYVPSVEEIRRKCALIRERWDKRTLLERRERVPV